MHKGNFYILDLPVYRLPEDQYYTERDAYVDKKMALISPSSTQNHLSTSDRLSDIEIRARNIFLDQYGGIWRYNEIIGYLRLYFLGYQVRAEYWRVAAKRIVRTRKKLFEFYDWKVATETELPADGTSSAIYDAIMEHIKDCAAALRDRYIDMTPLITLGRHVDWYALLHSNSP